MRGIYTALITPFNKSRKIDYSALKMLLLKQNNSKVTGIVVLGSTAEEKLLSEREKHNIVKLAQKTLNNKQIYVGINEISAKNAISAIKKYNKYKLNGYLVSPPPYLKLNQQEIINFYSKIAESTQKDICIYNIPSRTGTKIEAKTISVLSKLKNITATKDAVGDIEFTKTLVGMVDENFSILCGNDSQYIDMCKLGCHGSISVISNLYPNLFCEGLFQNQKIQHKYNSIINFLASNSNPTGIKYLLAEKGIIENILREPLSPINISINKSEK